MRRRSLGPLTVAAGIALAGLGCREPAAPPVPLRVVSDLWPGYFPGFYAKQAGLYDSLGVDVQFALPENTAQMLASFSAQRVDVLIASIADVLPVLDRLPDVRIVMCTDESAGADAVVGRRGVAAPAALRGKRVGVKLGGFSELFVRHLLFTAGLSATDVELVDLDASVVPAALREGRIDAGQTWEPYLSGLRTEGYPIVASSRDTPGLIVQCVFTRAEVVATREADLRRLVDGWFLGQDRFLADTTAGIAAVAAYLGRPATELSAAGVLYLGREENRRRFDGTAATPLLKTLDRQQQFYGSLGLLRSPVDAAALIDARFLQ
jgi:NitT/TauT family transport system substrate-binding protein